MAQPLIQPSFGAGEVAPSCYARVDLQKYHAGAALLRNMFVDYRGGAVNRAGTMFLGDSLDSAKPNRLIPFQFSTLQAYVLHFGEKTMKVIRDGAYVIDLTTGEDYVMATPYAAADLALLKFTQSADVMTLVHLLYAPRQLTRTAEDQWQLSLCDFAPDNPSPVGVTATPSVTGDATSYKYVVTAIGANGLTESLPSDVATAVNSKTMSTTQGAFETISWTAVPGAQFYNVYRGPEIPGAVAVDGQLFGFVGSSTEASFIDCNIAPDFSRTPPQDFQPFGGVFGGGVTGFNIVAGADYFNPPSVTFTGGDGTGALAHAYLGAAEMSANVGGSGYSVGDLLTLTGGIRLKPARARVRTVSGAGAVTAVDIIEPGQYADGSNTATIPVPGTLWINFFSTPHTCGSESIPVTGGTGTGALMHCRWGVSRIIVDNPGTGYTHSWVIPLESGRPVGTTSTTGSATVITSATYGNWPGCTTYYQQRQVFAGSLAAPDTFYMSKTGDYPNFGYSTPSRGDDSIIGSITGQQVNAIKHLVPMQSLIALSSSGAWKLDGGSPGAPITPSSIQAVPQAYNGCADVPPIVIGNDILYVQSKGAIVRDLAYNLYVNTYMGADMTPLANHLFVGHQITEWAYAEEPYKVIWAVRDDGVLLSFTFLKEQEVYAWAHHDTKGKYRSVCVIPEGNEDAVYVIVERYIQGAKHQYVERMASRNLRAIPEGVPKEWFAFNIETPSPSGTSEVPADLTLAWFVDCGLQYPLTYPAATLFIGASATTAPLTIAAAIVTVGGSGYVAPVLTVNDTTGFGAILQATVVGGVITAVTVVNEGTNFTNPTVSITDSAGVGAVVSLSLTRDVTMNSDAAVFSSADVGSTLRVNHGWGLVREFLSSTQVVVNIQRALADAWPAAAGEWSCTAPVSSVSGLEHLEGEWVSILADGNVLPQQQVIGARLTLEEPATAIVVGLPYAAQLQSLYIDTGEVPTIQGKRKKIPAVTVRVQDSRGFKVGPDFDHLDEPKERDFQLMGSPILPYTGDRRVIVNSTWDVPGQVCVQQDNPLPLTVLGLIPELAVGDTP